MKDLRRKIDDSLLFFCLVCGFLGEKQILSCSFFVRTLSNGIFLLFSLSLPFHHRQFLFLFLFFLFFFFFILLLLKVFKSIKRRIFFFSLFWDALGAFNRLYLLFRICFRGRGWGTGGGKQGAESKNSLLAEISNQIFELCFCVEFECRMLNSFVCASFFVVVVGFVVCFLERFWFLSPFNSAFHFLFLNSLTPFSSILSYLFSLFLLILFYFFFSFFVLFSQVKQHQAENWNFQQMLLNCVESNRFCENILRIDHLTFLHYFVLPIFSSKLSLFPDRFLW